MSAVKDDIVQPELPHHAPAAAPGTPASRDSESIYSKSSPKASHHDPEAKQDEDNTSTTTLLPQGRQLGVISATFLMVNRIVGTGVFATTSTILAQSGSVGMSLM